MHVSSKTEALDEERRKRRTRHGRAREGPMVFDVAGTTIYCMYYKTVIEIFRLGMNNRKTETKMAGLNNCNFLL